MGRNINSIEKCVSISDVIDFSIWVQDNYSQNVRQGSNEMLPKGKMREDFTDNIFNIEDIWDKYKLTFNPKHENVKFNPTPKQKESSIIYLLFGVLNFVFFAYDIEYDRDFWTWIWLLNSQISILLSFYLKLKK